VSHTLIPYQRPITLRADVWEHFPELARLPDGVGGEPQSRRMEVSPVDLGTVTDLQRLHAALVVFPAHDDAGPTTTAPVDTAAEVVERLAACCYDLERLGRAGFECLVGLASVGGAVELRYRSLDEAVERVESTLPLVPSGATGTPGVPVVERVGPLGGDEPEPGLLRRAGDAAGWGFADGSAVVFHPAALTMSRLDLAGLRLWAWLDTPRTLEEVLEMAEATSPAAVQQLTQWLERLERGKLVVRG
jgi:hypothetical protein